MNNSVASLLKIANTVTALIHIQKIYLNEKIKLSIMIYH